MKHIPYILTWIVSCFLVCAYPALAQETLVPEAPAEVETAPVAEDALPPIPEEDFQASVGEEYVAAEHEYDVFVETSHQALEQPAGRDWILFSPLVCCLQRKTVNWRHNSMYLHGCMPHGYDLRRFVQNVNHVSFSPCPLHANGPVEPGGSFAEAEQIDGADTDSIATVSLDISPPDGALPEDHAEVAFASLQARAHLPGTHRLWGTSDYHWNASLLNHQPLYFEDVNLERHGFSYGYLQPIVSGAKFFATLPALPYLMTARPPLVPRYTLGETKPGSHASYVHEYPPLSLKAGVVEAVAVTGLFFIIP